MLNVIMLNVIMLNVIMLNVIMLNVIMLSVVMVNVVAPLNHNMKFFMGGIFHCVTRYYNSVFVNDP
jgi:hypothetical protein